ncbi:MAG: hypothetical protein IPI42_04860 [Saprospiraceae bacterium]|nr:hypothetical protein [Candidatus Parvibacillus calidus]
MDDKFAGYVTIADEINPNAAALVRGLADMGVELTMLSGDSSKGCGSRGVKLVSVKPMVVSCLKIRLPKPMRSKRHHHQ